MNTIVSLIKLILFRIKWRKKNKHNMTTPRRVFNSKFIEVGKYSYGSLNVFSYGAKNEYLSVGNFVSIASGVKFILGGNHNIYTFSTYPFKVKVMGDLKESSSKGPIVIEDDAWLGIDCIILSGVKIGQGAIIGAGSVVSKNIPPYAIAAGNPAKVIKFRFDTETIDKLMEFDFGGMDESFIKKKIDLLYKPLNDDILNDLISK